MLAMQMLSSNMWNFRSMKYDDYIYSVLDLSSKLDEQLLRQTSDVAVYDPNGGLGLTQIGQICLCAQLSPIVLDAKSFRIAFPVSKPHIPIEMSQTMMILMIVVAHELYWLAWIGFLMAI